MRRAILILSATLISGCQPDPAPPPVDNAAVAAVEDAMGNQAPTENTAMGATDFAGRWTGPEGMFVDIAADAEVGPGHYTIRNRWGLDANMEGTFKGVVDAGVLTFTRPDGAQRLTPGTGAATGMKWLADKQDCLVARAGEGYCRD